MKTTSVAEFGDFVSRVMEDPNLPERTRQYLIAVVHEMRMQGVSGRSRLKGRPHQDITRGSEIWRDAAWLLNSDLDERGAWLSAKSIIGEDAPRYEMNFLTHDARFCVGTMLRPSGAPCKRRPTCSSSVPNPMTGELTMIGACNDPRHRAAFEAQHRDGWAGWRLNGEPTPANNTGGHLRRYLRYTHWDQLYAWANHRYQPGATPAPEPPRARLALVTPIRAKGSQL